MVDEPAPLPRLILQPPAKPDTVTLLDYFAAAVLTAGLALTTHDVFDKAAALVAESHRRKGLTP